MTSFFTLFKKELLEIYRSKKLLILIIVFCFTAISSPILAKLIPTLLKSMPQTEGITITLPTPTWKDAIDQLIKNAVQFGFIVLIFMFAGAIAEEKNKKTLEIVLTKPISRSNFVLAKFFASAFILKLVFIASAVIFYFYTVSLFETFSLINYAWLSLFLLIFLLLILSTAIFFSIVLNSQILSAGVTLIVSIAFTTIIGYIKPLVKYSPTYLMSNYKGLMSDGTVTGFLPSALFSVGLIIVLIVLATQIFKKQEIER